MRRSGRRLLAGAAAGAVGTLVMDLVWYRRARAGGSDQGFVTWDTAASTTSFAEAGAPAQVAARAAAALGVTPPDRFARSATNLVHWATGIGYGIGHALLAGDRHPVTGGLLTGASAVTTSYVLLGAVGVYEPAWRYDVATLRDDVTAHLAYGLATGIAYRCLR